MEKNKKVSYINHIFYYQGTHGIIFYYRVRKHINLIIFNFNKKYFNAKQKTVKLLSSVSFNSKMWLRIVVTNISLLKRKKNDGNSTVFLILIITSAIAVFLK